jgi:hypothetical protein
LIRTSSSSGVALVRRGNTRIIFIFNPFCVN